MVRYFAVSLPDFVASDADLDAQPPLDYRALARAGDAAWHGAFRRVLHANPIPGAMTPAVQPCKASLRMKEADRDIKTPRPSTSCEGDANEPGCVIDNQFC